MTWFKVDDKLHASMKARRAGDAMALWLLAGSWSAAQLTDGWIPEDIAPMLSRNWRRHARLLTTSGLWERQLRDNIPGWQFHDWSDYQPSRKQVTAEREAAAERQRRARQKAKERRDGTSSHGGSHGVTDGVTSPVSNGPPDPTRPVLPTEVTTKVKNVRSSASPPTLFDSSTEVEFERFWAEYPRKTHKVNGRKAWAVAMKKNIDPEVIIEAARRFAVAERGTNQRHISHAASWLNGERWNDEIDAKTAPAKNPNYFWDN